MWKRPFGTCRNCGQRTGHKDKTRCLRCYNESVSSYERTTQVISEWETMPDGVKRRTVEGGAMSGGI
jgi:hypothetical protein